MGAILIRVPPKNHKGSLLNTESCPVGESQKSGPIGV